MLYRVDNYTLEYIETDDKYYISFLDSVNQDCKIEIEKEIEKINSIFLVNASVKKSKNFSQ